MEITFDQSVWLTAIVIRQDPPGIWVVTRDGKAWFVTNRNSPEYARYYEMAFGLRPGEELYDLREDPDQLNNVADDTEYAGVKAKLSAQLMQVMEETNDPRLTDAFDFQPYMPRLN